MSKTNRDKSYNRYLEEDDDSVYRKESKKKRKRERRNVEKSLNDLVRTGADLEDYDEYLDDELEAYDN